MSENTRALIPWEEIKTAVEAGMSLAEASRRWNVKEGSVRSRATRDGWLTASKLQLEAKRSAAALARKRAELSPKSNAAPLTAAVAIGESLADIGERGRLSAAVAAATALEEFRHAAPIPVNWQEAKLAAEVLLKASGLDSNNAPPVQILITDSPARILDA